MNYILTDNHVPVVEPDVLTWARWFETAERRVAKTQITDNLFVSTVFLGIDHNFALFGPPVLFETMVFVNGKGGDEVRTCTWEQAQMTHNQVVEYVRNRLAVEVSEDDVEIIDDAAPRSLPDLEADHALSE